MTQPLFRIKKRRELWFVLVQRINQHLSLPSISPSTFLAVMVTNVIEQVVEAIAREVLLSPLLVIEGLAGYQSKEP